MRKKILIISLVVLGAVEASAQIEKKQLYPGITLGRRLLDYNTNSIQSSLAIGISDQSLVGMFYKYEKFNTHPSVSFKGYTTRIGGGISYSYYRHFNRTSKWGWYSEASLGLYNVRSYEKQNGISILTYQSRQAEFLLTPGVFFKPSPRIILLANVGSLSFNSNNNHIKTQFTMGKQLNVGLKISLGIKKNN